MPIEDEFNRSQALALDAENKALVAEIVRLRAALAKCGAPFDSGPTTIQNGMVAVAREFQIRLNIAANALNDGTMPPPTPNE